MPTACWAKQVRLAAMPDEEMAEAAEAGEDYVLLARLGAGLYTLQQCALIMGHLWFVGDLGVRKRILLLLHQQARLLTEVHANYVPPSVVTQSSRTLVETHPS